MAASSVLTQPHPEFRASILARPFATPRNTARTKVSPRKQLCRLYPGDDISLNYQRGAG
jgi:hypothetical protein